MIDKRPSRWRSLFHRDTVRHTTGGNDPVSNLGWPSTQPEPTPEHRRLGWVDSPVVSRETAEAEAPASEPESDPAAQSPAGVSPDVVSPDVVPPAVEPRAVESREGDTVGGDEEAAGTAADRPAPAGSREAGSATGSARRGSARHSRRCGDPTFPEGARAGRSGPISTSPRPDPRVTLNALRSGWTRSQQPRMPSRLTRATAPQPRPSPGDPRQEARRQLKPRQQGGPTQTGLQRTVQPSRRRRKIRVDQIMESLPPRASSRALCSRPH